MRLFNTISIFPSFFDSCFDYSVLKRGLKNKFFGINNFNLRDFSDCKHKKVDDKVYGGGSGMLMKAEPFYLATNFIKNKFYDRNFQVICFSPVGERLNQKLVEDFHDSGDDFILWCPRYEGIDHRAKILVNREISIGDFVVSNGELAASVFIDSIARLQEGVLGNSESKKIESFSEENHRNKEYPQYTKPSVWRGVRVPEVLKSGDHKKIKEWTIENTPDFCDSEKQIFKFKKNNLPLKGDIIFLREHKKEDIKDWFLWVNNQDIIKHTPINPPLTMKDEENYYEQLLVNKKILSLSICDKFTKKNIGTLSLELDNENEQSMILGIIIGDRKFWGKGICKKVLKLARIICFEKLNMNRIELKVASQNKSAISCYEKMGFRCIGIMKNKINKNGSHQDCFLYEMIKKI